MALIAVLNLQYWCDDENEKQRLKKIYSDNEIKYQQKLRKMYHPEDVFKNRQKQEQNKNEILSEEIQKNVAMVEYKKETFIDKIKEFFIKIFKKY